MKLTRLLVLAALLFALFGLLAACSDSGGGGDDDAATDDDTADDDSADDDAVDDDAVDDDAADDDATTGGYALGFDGTSGYVESANALTPAPTTAFTAEGYFWFRDRDYTNGVMLLDDSMWNGAALVGGFWLWLDAANGLQYQVMTTGSSAPVIMSVPFLNLSLQTWHHVALTFGATICLYLDGVSQACATPGLTYLPSSAHLFLGRADQGPPSFFQGAMDALRISQVARYEADFTPPTVYAPDVNTVAVWLFDEGAGTVANDATGNGNVLNLNGGVAWIER